MIEKKLFIEIPGRRNDFHSAVLTSFSFNFHHFEFQVLKTLKKKWVTSVSVLVDQNILNQLLGLVSGDLNYISQSYSLVGIPSKGAFHPKINFLVGDDKLLLFFGSGNISPGGHGKNHELFTGFFADSKDSNQLPLLNEAWEYLTSISQNLKGYNYERIIDSIPKSCSLISNFTEQKHILHKLDDEIEVALLYNESTSIFDQMTLLVPQNEIHRITVVSPFYDEKGETLLALSEHFKNAALDVYLSDYGGLPPVKMKHHKVINFYEWNETTRGKKRILVNEANIRKLHSKIFHFQSNDFEYCLIGSPNATIQGLGNPNKSPSNEEFGALYKIKGNKLLRSLGVRGRKKKLVVSALSRDPNIKGDKGQSADRKKIHIVGADLLGYNLKIYFNRNQKVDNVELSIFDGFGNVINTTPVTLGQDEFIQFKFHQKNDQSDPVFICFVEENKTISNKQLINHTDKLIHTDPAKGSRNLRQVISAYQGGAINEYEIIEYYNNLQDNNFKNQSNSFSVGSKKQDQIDKSASELTYEEAIEAAKDKAKRTQIVRNHSSIQLWNTLSKIFSNKQQSINDDLMDEEEEATAGRERDRNAADLDKDKIHIKNVDHSEKMIHAVERMVGNYTSSLKKIYYDKDHKIDIVDLSQYLLLTHVITALFRFSHYETNSKLDLHDWQEKLIMLYGDHMQKILVSFTKIAMGHEMLITEDDSYSQDKLKELKQKAIYHSFLYLYLVSRRCTSEIISEDLQLIGLNLLKLFDKPDKDFMTYLKDLSLSVNDEYFSPEKVLEYTNNHIEIIYNMDFKNDFVYTDHLGLCKVIESNSKIIRLRSLFGKRDMSQANFKKHDSGIK